MLLASQTDDFTPIELDEYHEGWISISGSSKNGVPFVLPDDKVNTSGAFKSMRFYCQAGFVPYSKRKEQYLYNRELLFGLYYQPYVVHRTNFMNRDTIRTDSILGNYVYYTEWSPMLGLSADYIFKTDPAKRAGAYFGFGAATGIAVHPVILENYGSFSQTIVSDTFSNGINTVQYFEGISDTKNTIPAVTSFLLEMRFPFGGSLRIADQLSLFANIEGKISKQVYLNGESFATRFGIAVSFALRFGF